MLRGERFAVSHLRQGFGWGGGGRTAHRVMFQEEETAAFCSSVNDGSMWRPFPTNFLGLSTSSGAPVSQDGAHVASFYGGILQQWLRTLLCLDLLFSHFLEETSLCSLWPLEDFLHCLKPFYSKLSIRQAVFVCLGILQFVWKDLSFKLRL